MFIMVIYTILNDHHAYLPATWNLFILAPIFALLLITFLLPFPLTFLLSYFLLFLLIFLFPFLLPFLHLFLFLLPLLLLFLFLFPLQFLILSNSVWLMPLASQYLLLVLYNMCKPILKAL